MLPMLVPVQNVDYRDNSEEEPWYCLTDNLAIRYLRQRHWGLILIRFILNSLIPKIMQHTRWHIVGRKMVLSDIV